MGVRCAYYHTAGFVTEHTMRLKRSHLFRHAASGYLSLQIPQIAVHLGPDDAADPEPLVDIPDNWVYTSDDEAGPPTAKGFWFLSRHGYLANRDVILEVYSSSANAIRGYTVNCGSLGGKAYEHLLLQFCVPDLRSDNGSIFYPKNTPENLRALFDARAQITFDLRKNAVQKRLALLEKQKQKLAELAEALL